VQATRQKTQEQGSGRNHRLERHEKRGTEVNNERKGNIYATENEKGGNVGVEAGSRNFSQNKYNLYSKSITAWACRHAENTFKEQTIANCCGYNGWTCPQQIAAEQPRLQRAHGAKQF